MHNPKLKHRLHRVDVPALFLRGESDGLVSADYLDALRAAPAERADRDHRQGRACRRSSSSPRPSSQKVLGFLGPDPAPRRRVSSMRAWHFSENGLSLPAAGGGVSIRSASPCRTGIYDPQKGAALYDRYINEWQIAEEEGVEIMLNEHHQTATCVDPGGAADAGGAGAADHEGAAPDPRQSDRQPPPAGARRRGDGDDRRAVARPPRGGLRARRALRDPAGEQQPGAHERAPLGSARPHRQGLDQP